MTPDKDPNSWAFLTSDYSQAAIMSIIITVLRTAYDGKETKWQRKILEALLCGSITYGIAAGLSYFNLPSGVSVFAGSVVGFLGADSIRGYAKKYIKDKISK